MATEIPPAARAEICKVLEWFDAHPRGRYEDMGEQLKALRDTWRDIIRGNPALDDPPLIDNLGTMQTVPGLSAYGRFFLLGQQAGREERKPGTDPEADKGIDSADLPFQSAGDLARRFGWSVGAVESFLRRYRERFVDCFDEADGRRRNEPRYLYRVADVLPALREHFGDRHGRPG
jgi:hypothetical protein